MAESLHRQYLAGNHDAVWYRLHQLGTQVREDRFREDARAVANEAMNRAAKNITTLVERLGNLGYAFGDPHGGEGATTPHSPPDEESRAFASWLEDRFGPIPLTSLRAIQGAILRPWRFAPSYVTSC